MWINGATIHMVKSTDGGQTFSADTTIVSALTTLSSSLPAPGGFPELPGGKFRVLTLPATATGGGHAVLVAWADYRDGVSRIYYRRSTDGGVTWLGPVNGQPLLPAWRTGADQHDFHPQLASRPSGEIVPARSTSSGPSGRAHPVGSTR